MVFEFKRRACVLAIAFASVSVVSGACAAEREPALAYDAPSKIARRVDDARHVRFLPRRDARSARTTTTKAGQAKAARVKAATTSNPVSSSPAARPAFAAPASTTSRPAVARRPVGPDRAATSAVGRSDPSAYGWLVTVNAKGAASPRWTGAQSYGFVGYPTLSFRRPGAPQIWSSPDDSISFAAYQHERFSIGPALSYRGGRYKSNAPELAGIHKPRWSLEGGVYADAWVVPETIRLRAEIKRGMRGKDGMNGSLGADYVHRVDKFTLAIGPRLRFGNDTFMRNQFGVSAEDNARNPNFARHDPKAGLYAVGLYASATYKQNEAWSYTLHGGYDRLRGDAAKSPIIEKAGSKNQWAVGAIVSYTFGWSGF